MTGKGALKNEGGAVLVIAMIVLLLLTLLGMGAITTSGIERGIACNEVFDRKTFFAAEAGLEHIKARLQIEFCNRSQSKIASGQNPDWDFALNGTVNGMAAATDTNFEGGAVWIMDQALDDGARFSCKYTVAAWNNPDDRGGVYNDTDRLLCIGSLATGPKGTRSRVEAVLVGQISGEAITGYHAQAGSGAGENNSSRDVRAISDFTIQ